MEKLPIGIDPLKINPLNGGWNWSYQFDNGYGASVVLHNGSYGREEGLFELLLTQAIVKGRPEWKTPDAAFISSINESEPGGDGHGLWGWLTLDDVARILGAVRGYTPGTPLTLEHTTYYVTDGEWTGTDSGARW